MSIPFYDCLEILTQSMKITFKIYMNPYTIMFLCKLWTCILGFYKDHKESHKQRKGEMHSLDDNFLITQGISLNGSSWYTIIHLASWCLKMNVKAKNIWIAQVTLHYINTAI